MPGVRLTTGSVYDANGAGLNALRTRWEAMYRRYLHMSKTYGTDRRKTMRWQRDEEPVSPEIEDGKKYTNSELSAKADAWLREDAKAELCRECGKRGEKTANTVTKEQEATDERGNVLILDFKELSCENGHFWFEGEGQPRGIGGENPILFEEHFQSRRRREIYTTIGTPDPSIQQGIYNRIHPQGRKVNSQEQRKRNGASFYR